MSFKANLAIILKLHSFKNIALPHKARYALQAHIFQGNSSSNSAMPFNLIQCPKKHQANVSKQPLIESQFLRSKKFNIEYQEQQIQLNDCCQFRMSLEGFPQLNHQQLYLQFILIQNKHCYFREDMQQPVDFTQAQRYRFKLQNISTGVMQYCRGQFCQSYISQFSFSLFVMITDYSFQPYISVSNSESVREKARENITSVSQLMIWGKKYLKYCENPVQYFYHKYIKNLRYNSVLFKREVNELLLQQMQIVLKVPDQQGQLHAVQEKQFFQYISNYQPKQLTDGQLKKAIYKINQQNFYFVQQIVKRYSNSRIDFQKLIKQFEQQHKDQFGERVLRNIVYGKDPQNKENNIKIATKMRKLKKITQLKIIDEHLFSSKDNQHYAFLQVNLPQEIKQSKYFQSKPIDQVLKEVSEIKKIEMKQKSTYRQRNMVIIFCHGFQATSYDMQMLKRQVKKILPAAILHASTANQTDTQVDISIMGKKLAQQIKQIISRHFEQPQTAIINFVTHSMGGIIARASLPLLQQFHKQMGFFFSLSSPHLGYLSGVDAMIKAGMWFMRKMNKLTSLDQLAMQDAQSLKDTYLYKLSIIGHLRFFSKIILVSSSQDSYVPWHSARICYQDSTSSRSRLQREMIDSILGDSIVHRIDIHFDISSTKDINSFIGRTAHINLLTQECIMKLITNAIPNFLDLTQV